MKVTEAEIVGELICDRDEAGSYVHTYIVLTNRNIVVARSRGKPIPEKTFRGYAGGTSSQEKKVGNAEWEMERIRLTEIVALETVELVSAGMLLLKGKKEQCVLASYTSELSSRAAAFAALVQKVKSGEDALGEKLAASDEEGACPTCGMIYPEEGRTVCPKCLKKSALFFRLLGFAKPYRNKISLVILLMLLNSAASLAIPYLMGTVLFDQALRGEGRFADQIGLVILLMIICRTIALLCGVGYGVVNAGVASNIIFDLKSAVFSSMQRLSLGFFQRRQTGQLMTRVNNDSVELQYFFVDGLSYFIVNAMNIIGIVTILLMLDWRLTLLCFLPMPIVILLVHRTFPKLWRMSWRSHRRIAALNSIISDSIKGTRVVKAFGKEQAEIRRFGSANTGFSGAEQSYNKLSGTLFPVLNALTAMGSVIIWAFGGWLILRGEIAFGLLLTFVHYMHMLYGPIQFLNNIVNWWSYCMTAAQRIFEIMDAAPDVKEAERPVELQPMKGDISLRNVSFGYEPNKPILKGVSLNVKAGTMLGVVGQSGAGKSTLVNLISRLYDVNEGEIAIDGINVKELSFASLRDQIGIVSQEVYVFTGTIAENIAYSHPDCGMDELIQASKVAGAHDFIMKLPDGYDTLVGTGNYALSGGEKQRLSIARAVLHNPKVLILDEATASLDTETELKIQEALEALIQGRTTIAIAHRLSTLRNADYLVVLDGGCIMEEGTHDELMDKGGKYSELVAMHNKALKMSEGIAG
ncbi:ABC transporter ATP-binding protein/permease [Paenibacillus sp. J5C_2022]|uniref:ABC transporter ATP-binding protein n=1 Tax=Paenibacillus sp. J5C2022 TaxID=2977129 RepID=UPI0021D0ACB3|nr:ABC transporter ATP-binding protein/permease [Paenibacillus sp. J5C2022]MCU6708142.1 ABC transporter ATP-binding protein/permease [Paenibacillus sp. J5C2022]